MSSGDKPPQPRLTGRSPEEQAEPEQRATQLPPEPSAFPDWDHEIFVSYARADEETALGLVEMLQSEGYQVWWDRELYAGQRFPEEIERAIAKAVFVICLWSKIAVQSEWVKREAALARRLIPVRLDDCDLPPEFADRHTLQFTEWPLLLKALLREMRFRAPETRSFRMHSGR